MIKRLVTVVLLSSLLAVGHLAASANPCKADACVTPGPGGVGVGGTLPSPGPVSGGGGGPSDGKHYETVYVPTCGPNTPENPDALCGAAVLSCPARGLQGIQMWVYRREVNPAGKPLTAWELIDVVCVTAYTPTTPDQVRTLLLSDSRFIPAPVSHTNINPSNGRSVVNAEVVFSADTQPVYSVDVPILGFTVHLDLRPQRWDWHFGDGQTLSTTSPGHPYPSKDVVHRYHAKGAFGPYVTVTWGGTFTFNGIVYPINGTTTVDGPASAITIAEAKSQLVGGPGH